MFAVPGSFFASRPDVFARSGGRALLILLGYAGASRTHPRRGNPMRRPDFISSNTFHWALMVAGVFAIFVIMLFGFIYWKTDQYLIARSDRMIASQMNVIAGLPNERRLDWINEHLEQDSRGVQYAGLFGEDGRKLAGNLERFPPGLKMNDSVQNVSVQRMLQAARETRAIRAIARHLPNGDA